MRLILVFLLIPAFSFSQKSDQQLAYQYFTNGEYEKAIVLYDELMGKRFSAAYYAPYYMSLLKLQDYMGAKDLAKKLVKKYPKELHYQLINNL